MLFHHLITYILAWDLYTMGSSGWYQDAEQHKVANIPTYGVLCAICAVKGKDLFHAYLGSLLPVSG